MSPFNHRPSNHNTITSRNLPEVTSKVTAARQDVMVIILSELGGMSAYPERTLGGVGVVSAKGRSGRGRRDLVVRVIHPF